MAGYLGDFLRGDVVQCWWNSYNSLGASAAPSAAGTAFVFKSGSSSSATQVGITLTATVLGGVHCVTVSMGSTTSFFQPHNEYCIALSNYSIDGQNVSGVIGQFSVENRYETGLIRRGTLQTASASAVSLDANASSTTSFYEGGIVLISDNTGALQARTITSYRGDNKTAGVDRAFITTPANGSTFRVYAGSLPTQDTELGTAIWSSHNTRTLTGTSTCTITRVTTVDSTSTVSNIAANAVNNTAIADNAISNSKLSNGAISSTKYASGAITSTVLDVGAIAVGTFGTGAISAGAIAAGALDADKFTVASLNSHADYLLNRGHDATSNTTRRVRDALAPLVNKVDARGSVGTVYGRDDSTSQWTFSHTTAGFPFSQIDPA